MKKFYTTGSYKKWHKRKIRSLSVRQRKRKRSYNANSDYNRLAIFKGKNQVDVPIVAPKDFRLIENTEACLLFFRNMRDTKNHVSHKFVRRKSHVSMTLKGVTQIDYATISVLIAISDDMKERNITLKGDFPDDKGCKNFLYESGFLGLMFNAYNKRYATPNESHMIFFEKGCGKLSNVDNRRIGDLVQNVVSHLAGEKKHFNPVKTILLEVCGNSIEHAYQANNKHWLLGVKYEADRVIFTVTDIGKGILETIHRKHLIFIKDQLTFKNETDVLNGAFDQKYGSSTLEINRNKGLPSIKYNYEKGTIVNLKVLTNNVILHFDNPQMSKTFPANTPRFKGTLYQWELKLECLSKA